MFNVSFYVICWLLFFLICLPIIFAGLFATALEDDGTKSSKKSLQSFSDELNAAANDKAALKVLLDEFMKAYKKYPIDGAEHSLWIDIISRFAANMNLMEVDEVVKFQDSLESANTGDNAIKEAIGKALQKRQNK